MPRHPIQPTELDDKGALRFKKNSIVRRLLDDGPFDLNQIALWDVPREDHVQLAQLIGYSLLGFADLSYVDNETYGAAQSMAEEGLDEKDARIEHLEGLVRMLRERLQEPMAELFEVHPDDLNLNGRW